MKTETSLFNSELCFWFEMTRPFWYDLGFVHPLFAPDYHELNYNFPPQDSDIRSIELRLIN
jgi:hypothetical protein